jgi:hypothetical protein
MSKAKKTKKRIETNMGKIRSCWKLKFYTESFYAKGAKFPELLSLAGRFFRGKCS